MNGYKVAVGDNGKCKFANKEFDDISAVVDFIKLRPLQGKDGHELRLKRDDDEPDQRRRTARSAGPGARCSMVRLHGWEFLPFQESPREVLHQCVCVPCRMPVWRVHCCCRVPAWRV